MLLKRWVLALCVVAGVALSAFVPHVLASRNSSGTYSLPAGNPVVSGTTITSTWANNTLSDISTELTSSLDRSGRGAMLAPLQCSNGTAAAPSLTFGTDLDTGLYRIGANNMGLSLGGSKYIDFSTTTPLAVTGAATISTTLGVTGAITASEGVTATRTTSNSAALTATGNGTGAGVSATGGATGNGVNGTGGATGGHGGLFLGAGTAGDGVNVTGKGTGQGVDSTGGDNSGTGVDARGGAPNGIGVYAEGSGTGQAIRANGTVWLSGSNPSSSTPFTNSLVSTSINKAWIKVTTNGSGTVTKNDGFNVGTPTISTFTLTIPLQSAMSTTAGTGVLAMKTLDAGGTFGNQLLCEGRVQSTSSIEVRCRDSVLANLDFSTNATSLTVLVLGAQ